MEPQRLSYSNLDQLAIESPQTSLIDLSEDYFQLKPEFYTLLFNSSSNCLEFCSYNFLKQTNLTHISYLDPKINGAANDLCNGCLKLEKLLKEQLDNFKNLSILPVNSLLNSDKSVSKISNVNSSVDELNKLAGKF